MSFNNLSTCAGCRAIFMLCFFLRVSLTVATEAAHSDTTAIFQASDSAETLSHIPDPSKNSNDSTRIVYLDKMVVTANRRQRLLESSQSLSIIRPDEWIGTNKSMADIVAEQTGVQTRRYGGTGSFQTVSIRGVQGSEVLVLLDGIPLNSAMGGAVDLGAINTDQIGEIELYKGITPARFGGNNIGGVINIKNKFTTKGQSVDLKSSIGGYGYKKYSMGVNQSYKGIVNLYTSMNYLACDNDWPYRNTNRTPYNTSDDVTDRLLNDYVKTIDARVQPSVNLPNGGTLTAAASFSNLDKGHPAENGHENHTAKIPREQLSFIFKYNPCDPGDGFSVLLTPEINYNKFESKTFWTSLDQDMGTSHGKVSSAPNSFAEYKTIEQTLQANCVADIIHSEYLSGEVSLSVKHTEIVTSSSSSNFSHGDWPGNSQEGVFAADLDGLLPLDHSLAGATIGCSVKGIRSATKGGHNSLFEEDVAPHDTIEFLPAFRTGIHFRTRDYFNLFANAGLYTDNPKLRELFGTNGAVIANPALKNEIGKTIDAGVRLSLQKLFTEIVFFRSTIENGIVFLSDGALTKPVNLAKSRTIGCEFTITTDIIPLLDLEFRSTLQNAINLAILNNYSGKRLPNEPDVKLLAKVTVEPISGLKIMYWLDYKSAIWRDFANSHRMPKDTSFAGIALHNAQIKWKPGKHLEFDFSIRNVNGVVLNAEDLSYYESGYELSLYPSNEWSITAGYSF